jgi:excisionase family DNA binding protein
MKLLDKNETCKELGISLPMLDKLMSNKEISYLKIGRCVRFAPDDLREFIESKKVLCNE